MLHLGKRNHADITGKASMEISSQYWLHFSSPAKGGQTISTIIRVPSPRVRAKAMRGISVCLLPAEQGTLLLLLRCPFLLLFSAKSRWAQEPENAGKKLT
ncbi:hypothetical protein CHARACLAT_016253 [Characodon lateralis]|uniref:Uncharacterized protein n=1 Tax=Characodon lateralis TaxID=208331 RepID=A0ABU7CPG9_9TELE|nr:hypothetical protein [Characodon lateralis]